MSITVTATFATVEEAAKFLSTFNAAPASGDLTASTATKPAEQPGVAPQPAAPASAPQAPAAPAPAAPPAAEPPVEKKKPGRPPKPAPAAEGQKPLTSDDVRGALMKVNGAYGAEGLSKVAEVIKPFGVTHIKDLKPEQFADVIKAAEAAVAAKQ